MGEWPSLFFVSHFSSARCEYSQFLNSLQFCLRGSLLSGLDVVVGMQAQGEFFRETKSFSLRKPKTRADPAALTK